MSSSSPRTTALQALHRTTEELLAGFAAGELDPEALRAGLDARQALVTCVAEAVGPVTPEEVELAHAVAHLDERLTDACQTRQDVLVRNLMDRRRSPSTAASPSAKILSQNA